jgi:BirA family biotin operon repressor/biotin-[acetyl-CoA-carboxylase] ligase
MEQSEHPYGGVSRDLQGTAFAAIRYVRETGSTNDDAAALLGDPAAYGLTIVAEHQTKGAGRKGRSWISPAGTSLLFTTILPQNVPPSTLWIAPFGAAIAVRRALRLHGVPAELKWPNDLLLNDKKLAGILCVTRVIGERAWIAAGVGINIRRTPEAAESIQPPPAFCDDAVVVDRAALLRDILLNYDVWSSMLELPPRIARVWERQAGLPGKRYRILKDGETEPFEATAIGLANGGGLIVERNGQREVISMADASALRDG